MKKKTAAEMMAVEKGEDAEEEVILVDSGDLWRVAAPRRPVRTMKDC